ncbi:hypothetical protein AAEO57_20430 [Flavobacterium sp. DGU38]|uniref:Lipoprotein n=1 Tax=Flavobacterium calami TaxID=3139144 RepID=A0ABU9IV99_9FLAO
MKNSIILLSIILLNACSSKKESISIQKEEIVSTSKNQTLNDFKGDTLKYVQTKILDRKEYYIGKKFEVLLNDLNIPIERFMYTPNFNNIKKVSNTIFEIYDGFETSRKLEKGEIPVNIIITWQPALNADEVDKLIIDRTKRGEWTPEKEAFFKQQIVGDVVRTNYNLDNYKKK